MRQRITFLQDPHEAVDPKTLKITGDSISTQELQAAREERITFGFEDLPQELYQVLKASHELHIRWVSSRNFDSIAPLVARLSPGLHAFYTPQRNHETSKLLCPMLRKVFGDLDCHSHSASFTTLPMERFSLSAATQYYQPLEDLGNFVEFAKHKLCLGSQLDCSPRLSNLLQASTLDIDFDTISHALTLTAFWPKEVQDLKLSKAIRKDRLEVGILSVESPQEPEELSLGGFLTVIGDDTKPKPTLFSFPARHHPFEPRFSVSFLQPTGLHPTLRLQVSSSQRPTEERSCSVHAHLTLPKTIFADRYQLSDPLFLASQNLSAIHHITTPVDLEASAYTIDSWGSSLLVELAPPSSGDEAWTATVPLHLRYLPPISSSSGRSVSEVPYPVVFWACVADEGSKFAVNPFDKVNLGYDGLFGPKTMLYHLSPEGSRLSNQITVPVLDLDRSKYVEVGTAAAVFVGFLWILWCSLRVWTTDGYESKDREESVKKKN